MKQRLIQIRDEIQKIIDELEPKKNKEFKPTDEQLGRWKNIAPTKKTVGLLTSKGFSDSDIANIKTQYDCHIILNNLEKKKDA